MPSCEFRKRRHAPATRDRFGSSSNGSTTKPWRLSPWYLQPDTPAGNQVNLLAPPLLQERGDYLASTLETRYRTTCKKPSSFARKLTNRKKHTLCLSTPTSLQPEGTTTSPQSATTDDNGTPATWTIWSCLPASH